MSYIGYNSSNANGLRVKSLMAKLQDIDADFRALTDLINAIGSAGALEANGEFSVATGQGQAFNDSFIQLATAWAAFYGDGTAGTNREKVSRFAR